MSRQKALETLWGSMENLQIRNSAYILKREGIKKPGNYQSFILTWIPRRILKEKNTFQKHRENKQVTAKRDPSSMSCHISYREGNSQCE